MDDAAGYVERVTRALNALDLDSVRTFVSLLADARDRDALVLTFGNGGSAASASHFVADLSNTLAKRGGRPIRAICLNDNTPRVTAIANDHSFDDVFARSVEVYGRAGDVVVTMSASGNSPNVLAGLAAAGRLGLHRISLLGGDGGKARALSDVAVVVPSAEYGPIEDVHHTLAHLAVNVLMADDGRGFLRVAGTPD